ncbi:MAG: aldehyde dehydrogenase family protein [Microgenomates group bacterium]
MFLYSTNPAKNYEVIGKVKVSSDKEIGLCVEKAHEVKEKWRKISLENRIKILKKIKNLILNNKEKIAKLITLETGKPIREAYDEVEFDQKYFNYFLKEALKFLPKRVLFEDGGGKSELVFEPYGVTAVITPWNFPLDLPIWGIVPNLLVGNTVVFKPSEETPLTGKFLGDLLNQVGLPEGVFNIVFGNEEVGKKLVDSQIDLIWFTGSSAAGQEIYQKVGKKFIKAVLELGGSSPAIVFADANLDNAIEEIYTGRFLNCGQVCTAIKRLLVEKSIFEKVVEKLKSRVEKVKIGDPLNPETEMGSLISKKQLEILECQVKDAVKKGAKIIAGGKKPDGFNGAFFEPTLLVNIKKNMRVYKEEVFGPVLPILPFKDKEEAIRIANDTIYGLSAEIYTSDRRLAKEVASQIQAGTISVNTDSFFFPSCPFGGYKKSGIGREHGEFGFMELVQIKHIHWRK